MKIGNIFGTTFITVIVAMAVYDLFVKGLLSKLSNRFDNTFNEFGETPCTKTSARVEKKQTRLQQLAASKQTRLQQLAA